jgi:lipopolysaccharide transport system ATP-binding protein
LLKLLSRVTAPTTGSIKTKGRIASLLEVGTGFHPDLTGRENIYMNGAILGMRRHEITRQLDEIVEFSGCAKYLDTPVKRYSSGMTVRLGFSVAAHLQSEILIVDEVLAVGDASFQRSCMGRLDDVAKSGRTVLFVSHNMAAMAALCTRCVTLAAGSTAFSGATQEAITAYLNRQRIDCTKTISVSSLPRPDWASERSIEFTEIMIVDPSDISSLSPVLTFRVVVKCSNPVEAFRIGITIYSDLEQPVGSAFTANMGTMHSSDQKTVTLSIKRPRLAPGGYHCSITITRGTIGCEPIPLDSLSNVLHFDVTKDLADVRYREWNRGWGQAVFDIEEHTFAAHLHPEAGAGVKNGKRL